MKKANNCETGRLKVRQTEGRIRVSKQIYSPHFSSNQTDGPSEYLQIDRQTDNGTDGWNRVDRHMQSKSSPHSSREPSQFESEFSFHIPFAMSTEKESAFPPHDLQLYNTIFFHQLGKRNNPALGRISYAAKGFSNARVFDGEYTALLASALWESMIWKNS